ncbi:MAG: hypothetical protein Q8K72_09190 [Acidimicrobiales bacterium]|nr:hypothetical protein [Acidimicrobiales bacterium]
MNVNEESERLLRAAMARILAGTPIRSNGSHTVSALAAEAGVSRRTAARATGVLRDFRDAVEGSAKAAAPPTGGEVGPLREALAAAQTKLTTRNAEVRRLRADLAVLACRVALLSEENAQLRGDRARQVIALPARPGR